MLDKIKVPFIKGLSVTVFTLLILTYQNCAKPLDDIGTNPSLSHLGSCNLTLSSVSVPVNTSINITYSFLPATDKLRIVVVNNDSGAFIENVYIKDGVTDVSNTVAGNYTVYGVVENGSGASSGNCQKDYVVTSGGTPPTPTTPSITLTGNTSSCTGTCTLQLTHNATNLVSNSKVFRIVKLNGSSTTDIVCKSTDGSATTPVALSYTAEPGLNTFAAYLVSTCATATAGLTTSATYNVTINPAGSGTNYTYSWLSGSWSMCDAVCPVRDGEQYRTVVCKRNDGVTVSDSYCALAKPATVQACYRSCPGTIDCKSSQAIGDPLCP